MTRDEVIEQVRVLYRQTPQPSNVLRMLAVILANDAVMEISHLSLPGQIQAAADIVSTIEE